MTASSAVSRKLHGLFEGNVILPLTGSPGIECRSGGGSNVYQVVIFFSNNVVSGSASMTGVGSVSGAPSFSTNTMTINLTGVTDVQQITVTATGVTDVFAQVLPSTAVPMKVLIGDSAGIGNSSVGAADINFVKSKSGQTADATNFRADIAVNASIGASDINLVKSKSGGGLP